MKSQFARWEEGRTTNVQSSERLGKSSGDKGISASFSTCRQQEKLGEHSRTWMDQRCPVSVEATLKSAKTGVEKGNAQRKTAESLPSRLLRYAIHSMCLRRIDKGL